MPQQTLIDCIGNTPLIALDRLFPQEHLRVLAKLEFLSPTGSIKDRIVRHIVLKAEADGRLRPGGTIVEGTSGNTGAAVAMMAALRGYHGIVVMPEKASREKQEAAKALGADVIVCAEGVDYIGKAIEIATGIPGAFCINQYDNLDNLEAHYLGTGPEIWADTEGRLDYFVAGAGTGGTVSGIARYLKGRDPHIRVVVPDPEGSIFGPYFRSGNGSAAPNRKYLVEGIGKNRLVNCMDFSVVDQVLTFRDSDAFDAARLLARKEGILAGGSSGANIWACARLAETIETEAVIVTVLPDTGLKYLSKFYDDRWCAAHEDSRSGDNANVGGATDSQV
jgi:cystathionine beta-synthase